MKPEPPDIREKTSMGIQDEAMSGADLICEAHQIALSAALDGEVDPMSLADTLGHLVECAACRRFVTQARALESALAMQSTLQPTLHLPEAAVPGAVWQRIAEEAWPEQGARNDPRWRRWAWGAAAATLVGLAAAGVWNSLGARVSQEVLTQEGAGASEFSQRAVPADSSTHRIVDDSGRSAGGQSR
jgi:predicted anti-sigma-YlaC factor YlaD